LRSILIAPDKRSRRSIVSSNDYLLAQIDYDSFFIILGIVLDQKHGDLEY